MIRLIAFSRVYILLRNVNLTLGLAKLASLRRELKHVEGVLQAILDDDMADFVWTSWFAPEHLLYS